MFIPVVLAIPIENKRRMSTPTVFLMLLIIIIFNCASKTFDTVYGLSLIPQYIVLNKFSVKVLLIRVDPYDSMSFECNWLERLNNSLQLQTHQLPRTKLVSWHTEKMWSSLRRLITTCHGQDLLAALTPPIALFTRAWFLTVPTSPAWPHWL